MLHDPRGRYLPVGIIDDDPAKRHLRAHRVPVLGNRHDIPEALAATGATTVVFSVANAEADLSPSMLTRSIITIQKAKLKDQHLAWVADLGEPARPIWDWNGLVA